ncbi:MAG: AMP-binding protein [Candidatus Sericytochromatia bacterium]|nr:AMP-binding protein [Candidatus Sericytochromatia bacterium]
MKHLKDSDKIEYFTLNEKIFYFSVIDKVEYQNLNEYELKTINFISDWLNGKQEFIINTSGSTGIPKPITIFREQMIISARMTGKALNLKSGYKSFICLSTQYIAGLMMIVRSLVLNLQMTIVEPVANPYDLLKQGFEFTALVPLQLYEMFNNKDQDINLIDNFKAILIGGGDINQSLNEKIQNLQSPIYHTYGMTETITHIALKRLNGDIKSEYFTTLENVDIKLDDRGCLVIRSPITNNVEIVTNDLVDIISKNQFKWIGRIDNVINTGGVKVQSEKVEKVLEKILYNSDFSNKNFFVSSQPDKKFGNIIIAVIEIDFLSEEDINNLKNELKKYLAKYEIPKHIYFISSFLLTKSGKVDKLATIKEIK